MLLFILSEGTGIKILFFDRHSMMLTIPIEEDEDKADGFVMTAFTKAELTRLIEGLSQLSYLGKR